MKKKKLLRILLILLLLAAVVSTVYDALHGETGGGDPEQVLQDLLSLATVPPSDGAEMPPQPEAPLQESEAPILDGDAAAPDADSIDEFGSYTEKDDVARYLRAYGRLPDNFITKDEASELGWPGGSLEAYAPGKCIGGDRFGNYEGLLPEKKGRSYTECDIGTLGKKSRGAKRIVFSNDGLIYYTDDHYESFTLLD